jgi:hypothetical protein
MDGRFATNHQASPTARELVCPRVTAIEAAGTTSDNLTSTWTSAFGPQTVMTDRLRNEGDDFFIKRHEVEYAGSPEASAQTPTSSGSGVGHELAAPRRELVRRPG